MKEIRKIVEDRNLLNEECENLEKVLKYMNSSLKKFRRQDVQYEMKNAIGRMENKLFAEYLTCLGLPKNYSVNISQFWAASYFDNYVHVIKTTGNCMAWPVGDKPEVGVWCVSFSFPCGAYTLNNDYEKSKSYFSKFFYELSEGSFAVDLHNNNVYFRLDDPETVNRVNNFPALLERYKKLVADDIANDKQCKIAALKKQIEELEK